jgi:putative transposase
VRRQCQLLGVARSGLTYQAQRVSTLNLQLLRLLDEEYTRHPFCGSRRLHQWLQRQGYAVNRKRVVRLLGWLGLQAIYPGPRTSGAVAGHQVYPYLLRGVTLTHVNQVWSTDITYIRLPQGFIYLVAVLDWFSRYVLAWEVSNTLDGSFCVSTLERALQGGQPEIFNTDQGSQFTSHDFTSRLQARAIRISRDGRGRALDNIFVERLWRSVKYEEVYLHDYAGVPEAVAGLGTYFQYYNHERLHQALGYRPPSEVYNQ